MRATGDIRRIAENGRYVIPKSIRESLDIKDGDPIEIFVEGDCIILRKYNPFCFFCGSSENMITYDGKNICGECAKKIGKLVK